MTLAGSERGKVEQFLAVPSEAETCGPVTHSTDALVFVCAQHPGEHGSFTAQRSHVPDHIAPGTQAGVGGEAPAVGRPGLPPLTIRPLRAHRGIAGKG